MAFFRKKKVDNRQKGGIFDPNKTEVYAKEYDSLLEALNSEISIGSKDFKEITFSFPDREVIFYSHGDNIINVLDPNFAFSIGNRVYWSDTITDDEKIELTELSSANDLFNYIQLIEKISEIEEINKFFNNAALENIYTLASEFNKGILVKTDVISDGRAMDRLRGITFLDISIKELSKKLERMFNKVSEISLSLGIDKTPYADITFKQLISDDLLELKSDSERLLVSAIDNDANLEDVKDVAAGFLWGSQILETIRNLEERNIIEVNYPGSFSAVLPELDILPEVEPVVAALPEINEPPVLVVAEIIKKKPVISPYAFKEELAELGENIKFHPQDYTDFINLIERNYELELLVDRFNQKIVPFADAYKNNRKEYEKKKFDRIFDREGDETKHEEISIEELLETSQIQKEGNSNFFTLASLEKEREQLNEQRRSILNELLELLNEYPETDLESFESLVNARITEIDKTETLALDKIEDELLKQMEEQNLEEFFEVKEVDSEFEVEPEPEPEIVEPPLVLPTVELDLSKALIYERLAAKYGF